MSTNPNPMTLATAFSANCNSKMATFLLAQLKVHGDDTSAPPGPLVYPKIAHHWNGEWFDYKLYYTTCLYYVMLYYIIYYYIILYYIILYYIILYYTILNIILYYIYMYLSRLMGIFSIHKYTIHCDKGFWGFSRHRSLDCKIDCLVSSFKHSLVPSSSPSYDPIPDFPIGVWNHQDLIGFDGEPWGKMTMPSWNSYLRQVFVTGSCRAGSAW